MGRAGHRGGHSRGPLPRVLLRQAQVSHDHHQDLRHSPCRVLHLERAGRHGGLLNRSGDSGCAGGGVGGRGIEATMVEVVVVDSFLPPMGVRVMVLRV